MIQDLIYDVGMHNGDDTAFYLSRGYRVVAIEANPALVDRASIRFADHIKSGRLVLTNVAIFPIAGQFDFWISSNDLWSSFDRHLASRRTATVMPIRVRCVPFGAILNEFGVPYFLKVDIEGQDHHCLEALRPDDIPRYVSWEASPRGLADLFHMRKLGYNAFKCIEQPTLRASLKHHIASDRLFNRAIKLGYNAAKWIDQCMFRASLKRHVATDRLIGRAVNRLQQVFSPDLAPTYPNRRDKESQTGGSGPFGDETDGKWQSFESITDDWLAFCRHAIRTQFGNWRVWFDFHATVNPRSTDAVQSPVSPDEAYPGHRCQ